MTQSAVTASKHLTLANSRQTGLGTVTPLSVFPLTALKAPLSIGVAIVLRLSRGCINGVEFGYLTLAASSAPGPQG